MYTSFWNYIYNKSDQCIPPSSRETLEYMTTAYLDIKDINHPYLCEDIAIWNSIYEEEIHNRLFEMELNYQEHTVHLRILVLCDLWPILHLHRWNLESTVLDQYAYLGAQYMKSGSLSYMFK